MEQIEPQVDNQSSKIKTMNTGMFTFIYDITFFKNSWNRCTLISVLHLNELVNPPLYSCLLLFMQRLYAAPV